jgi:nucleoside-diphosphate-sugar epimerase
MKNILVTGASGFVGTHVVRELVMTYQETTNVYILFKNYPSNRDLGVLDEDIMPYCHVITGDMRDYKKMEDIIVRYEIDTIINLGAWSIVSVCNDSPLLALENNVLGSANIFEVARNHKSVKHIITFTSDKSYGDSDKLPYVEDETQLNGKRPYEATKSLIDLWAQMYINTYNTPISIIRSANIFGEGDRNFSRLIPQVCTSLANNKNPWLWEGVADYVREFVYIKDVTEFILNLMDVGEEKPHLITQAYNLASNNVYSIKDLVNRIIKVTGKEALLEIRKKDIDFKEIPKQYLSGAKSKSLLDWEAVYTGEYFDEALINTYNYYAYGEYK